MTPREILLAHKGYRKRIDEQWEMHKWSSFYSMRPHVKDLDLDQVDMPPDLVRKKKTKIDESLFLKVTKVKDGG